MWNSTTIRKISILSEQSSIQVFWIFTFAILTAIGAQIEIPIKPVPYTAQTFFVLLAGGLLNKYKSSASMIVYLTMGAVGLPVFAGASFGFVLLLGPTGGYLLSFPLAVFVVGYLIGMKKSFLWIFISMFIGLIIIFALGTLQLNIVLLHNWNKSFAAGFLLFSWWDALKLIAATSIVHQYFKHG